PSAPGAGKKLSIRTTGNDLLLALNDALNHAMLRAWCAAPSGWCRGTIRAGAEKHHGLGRPVSDKAQQPRPHWTAAFFMPTRCAWRTVCFLAGCVGTSARVCRYLIPVDQPDTACHPCLVAWEAGF